MSRTRHMFGEIAILGASFGVCLMSGEEQGQSLGFRAILPLLLLTTVRCFRMTRVTQGVTSSVSPVLAEVLLLALLLLSLVPVFPARHQPLDLGFFS